MKHKSPCRVAFLFSKFSPFLQPAVSEPRFLALFVMFACTICSKTHPLSTKAGLYPNFYSFCFQSDAQPASIRNRIATSSDAPAPLSTLPSTMNFLLAAVNFYLRPSLVSCSRSSSHPPPINEKGRHLSMPAFPFCRSSTTGLVQSEHTGLCWSFDSADSPASPAAALADHLCRRSRCGNHSCC